MPAWILFVANSCPIKAFSTIRWLQEQSSKSLRCAFNCPKFYATKSHLFLFRWGKNLLSISINGKHSWVHVQYFLETRIEQQTRMKINYCTVQFSVQNWKNEKWASARLHWKAAKQHSTSNIQRLPNYHIFYMVDAQQMNECNERTIVCTLFKEFLWWKYWWRTICYWRQ